ncbi:MAG: hypothetical protein ABEJ07_00295 [Candidatus Nanohaloarchaea archaeon]
MAKAGDSAGDRGSRGVEGLQNFYDSFEGLVTDLKDGYDSTFYLTDPSQDIPDEGDVLVLLGDELWGKDDELSRVTEMLEETGQDFVIPRSKYGSPLPGVTTVSRDRFESAWAGAYGKALYFRQ